MIVAFLLLSLLVAVSTFSAVVVPRRPTMLGFLVFLFGLLPSELPFVCLVWDVVLLVVFGMLGTFDSTLGVVAVALLALSAVGQIILAVRAAAAGPVVDRALRDALGATFDDEIDDALARDLRTRVPLPPVLLTPFVSKRRDVVRVADLAYGDAGIRNWLDLYYHRSRPEGSPILVYVHGGAWVTGKKSRQGMPIVYHFARRGWLCVAPNYRLCPAATFPDQLVDVKRVIAWVREHAEEYGGDPSQVFMAGGSAGGHLTALAALTANDSAYQPGFEHVDTSLTAAMPLYGDYDWLDSNGERQRRHLERFDFFADKILKCSLESD
ncbi:MAG TPA: alpha/beta hydrolase, partial [Acidimicrobiia bacterium]